MCFFKLSLFSLLLFFDQCETFTCFQHEYPSFKKRSFPTYRKYHIKQRSLNSKGDSQSVGEVTDSTWSPASWRKKNAHYMPEYEDIEKLKHAEDQLSKVSPLVFAGECRNLHESLAKVAMGQGFVLIGGDSSESLRKFSVDHVRDIFRVLLQMSLILTYGSSMPVVKIGRMAGQYAVHPVDLYEEIDGVKLPSYRGDHVNSVDFTPEARQNDPQRMVDSYFQSAQTLNILRAFSKGGYADIHRLHAWNLDFVEQTDEESKYRTIADKVEDALLFMRAVGIDTRSSIFSQTSVYTGHECLLLPFEQALTRVDSITGRWYDCSAHLLWIGDQTRQLEGAHLEFVKGIANPIALKISDTCSPQELIQMLDKINPKNIPGRVTLITRMGAEKLRAKLPGLVRAVQKEGRSVLWVSDPMHANTILVNGLKAQKFEAIRAELRAFFDIHEAMGSHPGGVLLTMTDEDVTECIGGNVNEVVDLTENYCQTSYCDPRLNPDQALELSFLIADRIRRSQGKGPIS